MPARLSPQFLILAAIAAQIAAPALAGSLADPVAEPVIDTPAPQAASGFAAGLWVGGSVGMGSVNYDLVTEGAWYGAEPPFFAALDLPDMGGSGAFAALEIGHDWAVGGAWRLGLQLDYEVGNVLNDTSFTLESPVGYASLDYELNRESAVSGLARVGYAPSDRVMFYGLAGPSRATFSGSYDLDVESVGPNFEAGDSYEFDVTGLTLGLGVETAVSAGGAIKFEYRRTDFEDYELIDTEFGDDGYIRSAIEANSQTFRVTYAHRF